MRGCLRTSSRLGGRMAVDKTRPAGAPADDAAAASAPSDEHKADEHAADEHGAGANPDLDEMKRKFRAALDRKRGTHATGNAEGAQDTGKVHGSHGPAAPRGAPPSLPPKGRRLAGRRRPEPAVVLGEVTVQPQAGADEHGRQL